jgi:hypothetical protein
MGENIDLKDKEKGLHKTKVLTVTNVNILFQFLF